MVPCFCVLLVAVGGVKAEGLQACHGTHHVLGGGLRAGKGVFHAQSIITGAGKIVVLQNFHPGDSRLILQKRADLLAFGVIMAHDQRIADLDPTTRAALKFPCVSESTML